MPELTTLKDLESTPHADVFEADSPRTVRLQLESGEQMPGHNHPGTEIVLHLVSGELELSLDEETYSLDSGDLIQFSGEREISPHAIEESTVVIVFAPATA